MGTFHYVDSDKSSGHPIVAAFIDADATVAAGRKVFSTVVRLTAPCQAHGLQGIRIRIGINSDSAIQGRIGTSNRDDVTVIGHVVHTAARIESATEPMRIGIAEATYARLRDSGQSTLNQPDQLKNRTAPAEIDVAEPRDESTAGSVYTPSEMPRN